MALVWVSITTSSGCSRRSDVRNSAADPALAGPSPGLRRDIRCSALGRHHHRRARQSLTFTMPIAPGTHFIVMRKGETRIKKIGDLNGLTVGVQQGSAQFQSLPELQETLEKGGGKLGKVVQYASYPEAYQDLAAGRTDYVINSAVTVASLVRERPNVFQAGTFPVSRTSYHAWAVKRGQRSCSLISTRFSRRAREGHVVPAPGKVVGQSFRDMPRVGLLPGDRPMPD